MYDRCHHGCIDDYTFQIKDAPGHILLDKYVIGTNDKLAPSAIEIERVNSTFQPHNLFSYSVTIPPSGLLGLTWKNDLDFGIPLVVRMSKDSPFKKGCKKQFQSQVWIYALQDEEPIIIERVAKQIEYLRQINKLFSLLS